MKTKIYILLISLFALWSCNDYEEVPVDDYTLEYVFSTTDSAGTAARGYLSGIYSVMLKDNQHNRIDGDYLDAATDNAISASLKESQAYKLAIGDYDAINRIESDMRWQDYYLGIRRSNTYVDNIDVVPFRKDLSYTRPDKNGVDVELSFNTVTKAEARFLRALYYFELVRRYGGVPIVGDDVYEFGKNIELPRNTFEDCIEYIVKELNDNKEHLRLAPIAQMSAFGHVPTEGSAMALISRVRLLAASPLFSASPIRPNNPLIGYTNNDAEEVKKRWQAAADAAYDFINKFGHDLGGDGTYDLVKSDFRDIFLGYTNSEVIFHVQGGQNYDVEKTNGPTGFLANAQGKAQTSPTQDLVDAFPMLDGKPRGQSDKYSYSDESMYDNRDPRLEYTVLHNGSLWLSMFLETYSGGKNNPNAVSIEKTKTTYYMRKFMDKMEDRVDYTGNAPKRNWIMLRYAEILLNYAEAKNEVDIISKGENALVDAKVLEYVRYIRERAGIEDGGGTFGIDNTTTCLQMRDIIRNERRIEFAFEEHRFRDIRRWKIAEKLYEQPFKGLQLEVVAGILQSPVRINVQPSNGVAIPFDEKRYLHPISYDEVNKNSNMVQNPGW